MIKLRLNKPLFFGRRLMSTTPKAKHYDIITIGSGGGAKVSTPAANLGFKVAMIEHGFDVFGVRKSGLGGTCLNKGCIPSKMLIHPADIAAEIKHEASRFGMDVSFRGIDFEGLVTRVSNAVDKDSDGILKSYDSKSPNKHLYQNTAKFVGPKTIQVGNEILTADYIFITTGAVPQIPDIPGLKDTPYLTSTEALRLKKQPKKLIVLGAGYIACELGHYFGALGTDVHFLVRSKLVRHVDSEVQAEFESVFTKRYNCHMGAVPKSVKWSQEAGFEVTYTLPDKSTKTISGDQLLVATGVVPASSGLDLDKTGVQLRDGGFVKVDEQLRTTCPGIWCFGDLAGNYLFRHCANFEGEYLVETVIHPLKKGASLAQLQQPAIDYTGMPWAVFANPQVAGVGLTEDECKQKGLSYVKGLNRYVNSAMEDARMSDHGFVKLLIEQNSRRILGCHIVGYEASTFIHAVIPMMRLGGKLEDLLYCIYIHPALPEILRNASRKARDALVAAGDELPLKLLCK